jgi:hypothetical protein
MKFIDATTRKRLESSDDNNSSMKSAFGAIQNRLSNKDSMKDTNMGSQGMMGSQS